MHIFVTFMPTKYDSGPESSTGVRIFKQMKECIVHILRNNCCSQLLLIVFKHLKIVLDPGTGVYCFLEIFKYFFLSVFVIRQKRTELQYV